MAVTPTPWTVRTSDHPLRPLHPQVSLKYSPINPSQISPHSSAIHALINLINSEVNKTEEEADHHCIDVPALAPAPVTTPASPPARAPSPDPAPSPAPVPAPVPAPASSFGLGWLAKRVISGVAIGFATMAGLKTLAGAAAGAVVYSCTADGICYTDACGALYNCTAAGVCYVSSLC